MLAHLLHLFTPHSGNNHRARILHPAGLSLLIGIYLFSQASIQLLAQYDNSIVKGSILGYASNISVVDVIAITNQERLNNGQLALTENPKLNAAAQSKAADMFASDYWAHNNPQNGRQPWNFIREAGYVYRYAGENLARDFGDTPSMVTAWMASPSHRANIVSPNYQETGVAVVNGSLQGVETTLVVQMFGTRAGQQTITSTLGQTNQTVQNTPTPSTNPVLQDKSENQTPNDGQEKNVVSPITVAQAAEPEMNPIIPPLAISKSIALSILFVLIATLIIDYFIITRRKIIRLTGKNLAHLAFFVSIIIIVLVSQAGGIL